MKYVYIGYSGREKTLELTADSQEELDVFLHSLKTYKDFVDVENGSVSTQGIDFIYFGDAPA